MLRVGTSFFLSIGAGLCLVAIVTFGVQPQAAAGQDSGWTQPLADLGIDGSLRALPYPRNWTLHRASSYDRTGGAEDDRYGRQVYDGGVVLADMEGPGAVLRMYAENPWGSLLIYVDDMEHPVIVRQFEDIFTGELELFSPAFPLFAPPFTGVASGGHYSYVPIPFAERCRIIAMGEGDALNYHVDYAKFPEGTPVRPFELRLSKDDLKYFRTWRDAWTDYDFKMHDLETEELHQSSTILWPESNYLVYMIEGPGVITELEFTLDSFQEDFTGDIWVAAYFDHQEEPGVLAPIGDFFGRTATDGEDYSGVVVGNIGGRMWNRYPMPFREFAEIRVFNTTNQAADFRYNIIWRPGPVHNQQYFYARYHRMTSKQDRPVRVADLTGSGHFAGATIAADGSSTLDFLHGDDIIRIDGQPAAAFHGTATDSFFNSGGYFATGTYAAPTHACSVKAGSPPPRIGATRTFVTDVVPFRSSFTFELEHGNRNNQPGVQYESVAYWYQSSKNAPVWPIPELEGVQGIRD